MYQIFNVSFKVYKELHVFYMPSTVITESIYDKHTKLYALNINENAILKINDGNITIDLGGKLYTINREDYSSFMIM